jgi:hypothetical protein
VDRAGTRVQYGLGKDGTVEYIGIGVPYDRYQQVLGVLISQFGPYGANKDIGLVTYYQWKPDQGVVITLKISRDSHFGIAEFWIKRVPSTPGTK